MTRRKRRRYDDKFKVNAVLTYEANPNYVFVAKKLGIPESTLRSWVNTKLYQDKMPQGAGLDAEVYDEKKIDLVTAIIDEVWGILGEMPVARAEASFRELGTVLGILVDKKQLLSGEPTERSAIVYDIEWDDNVPNTGTPAPWSANGAAKRVKV